MKISKYIYLLSNNDKYFVVQTRYKKIYNIEKEVFDCLNENKIEGLIKHRDFGKFIEYGLLIEDSLDETSILEKKCIEEDNDDEWNSLHIIPSLMCNMGCEYCFVLADSTGNISGKTLDDDTLYSMIDFFVENNPAKKKAMTFYGGEPFVNKDIVFKAVDYANEKYKGVFQYKIVTNGTLITKEIAEFLYKNGFDVNLSIDGNKKAHDRFRLYKNGKSTYDDVIKGYELLKSAGNSIKILVTVGDHNIDSLEKSIMELIRLNPTSIALNLPKKLQYNDNRIDIDDYEFICKKYFECLDLCYKYNVPEAHFADIIYGFLSENVQYRPCSGCGKQIALSPFGKIGPCQAYATSEKYFINFKKIKNKVELRKTDEFDKWKKITMYSSKKCRDCYLLPICAGDCPFDWENREGNFDNPPEGYCITRKRMFDYLIARIVNGQNILFKREK